MNICNSISVLGFPIAIDSAKDIVDKCLSFSGTCVVNTINPHSYVVQKSDQEFSEALKSSDVLLPDGSGVVFAARVLLDLEIKKIAGYDIFIEFMNRVNRDASNVFLLGSTDTVLRKMCVRASKDFSKVSTTTFSPPFKSSFSKEDVDKFASRINKSNSSVVFVGLTAPKQEKLVALLKPRCKDVVFVSIGAVFDFYAGSVKRPSAFWVRMNLEWLVRLLGEPRRLWRRNFVSTPIFLKDVLMSKALQRKS